MNTPSRHRFLPSLRFGRSLLFFALAGHIVVSAAHGQQTQPSSNTENEEVVVLEEFSVRTSANDTSIKADETLGALRTSTKLTESPITVAVLKPEFLEAFMLDDEYEQSAFVAGSNLLSEWQTGSGTVKLRGFSVPYFRNGFRREGLNAPANIERIEYVKGPMAAMFGRSAPGGMVNYITKRAQRRQAYDFGVNTGPMGYQNAVARMTGPLAENVFYRIDGSYRNRNGHQDFFYQRVWTASSSVTWRLGRDTSLMFDFEHVNMTTNRGTVGLVPQWTGGSFISPITGQAVAGTVQGGRITRMDKFNALGPDTVTRRSASTYDLRFEHRFSRYLSLRMNGQYWNRPFDNWSWSIPAYNVATGTLNNRQPRHEDHIASQLAGQVDLLATFKIGPTAHKLLVTTDYSDYTQELREYRMADYTSLPVSMRNLSVASPDWTTFDRSLVTSGYASQFRDTHHRNLGFLVSERMELLKGRVLLYGSLRHDSYKGTVDNWLQPETSGRKTKDILNETFGGVVHIIRGKLLAFANRSTSFEASTTVDRGTGELQNPITAEGIEAGVRGEITSARPGSRRGLYWSASMYRIDRKVPQINPQWDEDILDGSIEPGTPQYLNSGVERIDGIEFEIFGELSENISFSAAYTKLDGYMKNYPDEPAREGVALLYVPNTSLSSSLRYRVTQGVLKGASWGATMRYTSEYFARYGTAASEVTGSDIATGNLRLNYGPANRIEEVRPEVVLFDLFAEYQFRTGKYRHTVGVNLKNLTDKSWWGPNGQRNLGRQLFVRYRVRF